MAAFLNCDSLIRKENDNSINYNTKMKCFLCEEDYPVYKLKMIARENEYVCKRCVKVSRSSGSRFDVTIRDMLRHVVAPIKLTEEQFAIKLPQSDDGRRRQAEPSLAAPKTRTSTRTAPVASAQQFRTTRKRNRKYRRRINNNVTSAFQLCRIAAPEQPSSIVTTAAATVESKTVTESESSAVSSGGGASIENDKAVIYSVQTLPKPPTTAIVVADAGSSASTSGTNVIVDMNDALKSICEALGLFKVDTADLRGSKTETEIASVERSISVNLSEETLEASDTAVPSIRCRTNDDNNDVNVDNVNNGDKGDNDDNDCNDDNDDNDCNDDNDDNDCNNDNGDGEEGIAKLFEPDDDTNVDDQMANYFKLDDGAEFCSIDHFLNTDEVQQHFLNDVSKNDQDLTASSFLPTDHHQRRTAKQKK